MTAFVSCILGLLICCLQILALIQDVKENAGLRLYLSPLIRSGNVSEAIEASEVNSTFCHGIKSHSGFITVKEEYNSNLYFWFFPAKGDLKKTPWIIWLNGGPGVSSLLGLFELIGPIKIEDGKVELRNVTWATNYSLLFLDQPVGAGFSFTENDLGYTNNEDDIGEQMYEFLTQFLQMFPELKEAPLFIAGESYAGKYIPALGIQIHRWQNKKPINLKGLAIGNGLIDPRSMMHYSDLCKAIGILSDEQLLELKDLETSVVKFIDAKDIVAASNKFNETIEYIKTHSSVSVYNYLQDNAVAHHEFEDFVTKTDVRNIIHAGDAQFDLNNQLVYTYMLPDIMNTTKPWVEELLEHYAVMSYSGQLDIILAYSLSKHTFKELRWSRRSEYAHARRRRVYDCKGSVVAYKKSGGNFTDVLIRNAGHTVPVEQPEVMKFIIDKFIDEFK